VISWFQSLPFRFNLYSYTTGGSKGSKISDVISDILPLLQPILGGAVQVEFSLSMFYMHSLSVPLLQTIS
jgi:hypothetical protein